MCVCGGGIHYAKIWILFNPLEKETYQQASYIVVRFWFRENRLQVQHNFSEQMQTGLEAQGLLRSLEMFELSWKNAMLTNSCCRYQILSTEPE